MGMEALHQSMMGKFKPRLVCGPETDIVIEGFPRSSNSFTIWMLEVLQGEDPYLSIAHHTHSVENLTLAVHFDKPIVILVRPPEDAILSYMIYSGCTLDFAVQRYQRFFSHVLRLPERPVVIEFDTVVSDFNQVVARINALLAARGGKPVPLSQDLAADTATVKEIARERAEEIHGERMAEQMSVPSEAREEIKASRRAEVRAYLTKRPGIVALYEKVLAYGG